MAKLFGIIGQSKPVHWVNMQFSAKLLNKKRKQRLHLLDIPASERYQKWGKEAQNTVGIPEEQHVPIKMIGADSPRRNTLAIAETDGIYVNESKLNKYSDGFCRSVLFHEAVHIKYHDAVIGVAIGESAAFLVYFSVYTYMMLHRPHKLKENIAIASFFRYIRSSDSTFN